MVNVNYIFIEYSFSWSISQQKFFLKPFFKFGSYYISRIKMDGYNFLYKTILLFSDHWSDTSVELQNQFKDIYRTYEDDKAQNLSSGKDRLKTIAVSLQKLWITFRDYLESNNFQCKVFADTVDITPETDLKKLEVIENLLEQLTFIEEKQEITEEPSNKPAKPPKTAEQVLIGSKEAVSGPSKSFLEETEEISQQLNDGVPTAGSGLDDSLDVGTEISVSSYEAPDISLVSSKDEWKTHLQDGINSMKSLITEFEEKLTSSLSREQKLAESKIDLENKYNQVIQKHKQYLENNSGVTQTVSDLKALYLEKTNTAQVLGNKVEKMKLELQKEKENAEKLTEQLKTEKLGIEKELNETLAQTQKSLAVVKGKYDTLVLENKTLQTEQGSKTASKEEKISALEKEISLQKKSLEEKDGNIKKLELTQKDQIKILENKHELALKKLKSERESKLNQTESAKTQEINTKVAEIDKLKASIADLTKKKSSLETKMKSKNKTLATKEAKIKTLTVDISNLQKDNTKTKEFKKKIDVTDEKLKKLETERNEQKALIDKQTKELAKLNDSLHIQAQKTLKGSTVVQKNKRTLEEHKVIILKMKKDIAAHNEVLNERDAKIADLKSQLKELNKDKTDLVKLMGKQLLNKQKEIKAFDENPFK
jgi:hypothetical protein